MVAKLRVPHHHSYAGGPGRGGLGAGHRARRAGQPRGARRPAVPDRARGGHTGLHVPGLARAALRGRSSVRRPRCSMTAISRSHALPERQSGRGRRTARDVAALRGYRACLGRRDREFADPAFVAPGAIPWLLLRVRWDRGGADRRCDVVRRDLHSARQHRGRRGASSRMQDGTRRWQASARALHRRLRVLSVRPSLQARPVGFRFAVSRFRPETVRRVHATPTPASRLRRKRAIRLLADVVPQRRQFRVRDLRVRRHATNRARTVADHARKRVGLHDDR